MAGHAALLAQGLDNLRVAHMPPPEQRRLRLLIEPPRFTHLTGLNRRGGAMRYQRSSREQKGWILDEFCAATGYNRKYAIKLLRGPFPRAALPPGHGRPPVYGPEEVALLRPCWQIADYVCSK